MVRLNPLNPELGGEDVEDFAQAQVVDDILSAFQNNNPNNNKRARSSLDYKGDSDTLLPRAQGGGKSNEASPSSSFENTKWDYSQFEGLTSAEVMKKLQENPDLARQLQEDSKKFSKRDGRLENLKNQGFPFTQWAIIILLLTFVTYRVHKLFQWPKGPKKAPARPKAGPKKVKRKKGVVTSDEPSTDDVLNKVLAEIEGTDNDDKLDKATAAVKKKPKKSPKAASVVKPNKSKNDSGDGDGSRNAFAAGPMHELDDDDDTDDPPVRVNGVRAAKPINGSANISSEKTNTMKNKNGEGLTSQVASSKDAETDEDAALAMRLQERENNLDGSMVDDEWAEVTNKKKKKAETAT